MEPVATATWRPLFDAAESAPYRAAIAAVASDLAHPAEDVFPFSRMCRRPRPDGSGTADDVAAGRAGVAVLHAYLDGTAVPAAPRGRAGPLLEEAVHEAAAAPFGPRLFADQPGVAWAVRHLARPHAVPLGDDLAAAVDEALDELLAAEAWRGGLDLVGGLVGIGVLACEDLPDAAAAARLDRVVELLAGLAHDDGPARLWPDPPGTPARGGPPAAPGSRYDLGLAHGIPGVVALLARAHAAGRPRAGDLLASAADWLTAQRPLDAATGVYPYWRDRDGGQGPPSRQGWCYGAPGQAIALLLAAWATGHDRWRTAGLARARLAAATPPRAARIVDPGLCHGAAGVAHVFNRIHQATGSKEMRRASRAWFRRLLAMRRPGRGVGGFRAYLPRPGRDDPWVADGGLVTGAAGAALAMLAAVGDREPCWDRLLLTALPPGALCGKSAGLRPPP